MESLKSQVAVVTGASSGIGKAIALALTGQGTEQSALGTQWIDEDEKGFSAGVSLPRS